MPSIRVSTSAGSAGVLAPRDRRPLTTRALATGVSAGVVAGVVFAAAQSVGSLAAGGDVLAPFRLFASIALGQRALDGVSAPLVVAAGAAIHLTLSGLYGAVYAFIVRSLSDSLRFGWVGRVALGATFGALLWLVNMETVGRFAYPWFLDHPAVAYLLLHVLFFGVPLGLAFEARARHVLPRAPATGAVARRRGPRARPER